jgi:hypothetical protein
MLISEGVSIGREMRGGRLSRLLFLVMLAESPYGDPALLTPQAT